jgi:hypothetical protein
VRCALAQNVCAAASSSLNGWDGESEHVHAFIWAVAASLMMPTA